MSAFGLGVSSAFKIRSDVDDTISSAGLKKSKKMSTKTPVKSLLQTPRTNKGKSALGGRSTAQRKALGELSHAKLNELASASKRASAQQQHRHGHTKLTATKSAVKRVLIMEDPPVAEKNNKADIIASRSHSSLSSSSAHDIAEMVCSTSLEQHDEDVSRQVLRDAALAAKRSAIEESLLPESILSADDFDYAVPDYSALEEDFIPDADLDRTAAPTLDLDLGHDSTDDIF